MTITVDTLKDQIHGFLADIQAAAQQQIGDQDIPLLGAVTAVAGQALFGVLEDTIDSKLDALASTATVQDIIDALNTVDGLADIAEDVATNGINFSIKTDGQYDVGGTSFNLGTGSGGVVGLNLGATLGGTLKGSLDVALHLGDDGFLVTDGSHALEVSFDANVSVNGDANLGFLEVSAQDADASTPEAHVAFTLGLQNGSVASVIDAGVATNVTASVALDLALTMASEFLPTIGAELKIAYPSIGGTLGPTSTPTIELDDVTIDLGSIFGVFADVIERLDKIIQTQPLGTIFSILTGPLPLVDPLVKGLGWESSFDQVPSLIKDGNISLLDLVALKDEAQGGESNSFLDALGMIATIHTLAERLDGGELTLGSFDLTSHPTDAAGLLAAFQTALGDNPIGDFINSVESSPVLSELTDAAKAILEEQLGSEGSFDVPIIDDPNKLVAFLFNQVFNPDGASDIDIVKFQLPDLELNAYAELFFPILGPLGLTLNGEVNASFALTVGYDTYGLTHGGSGVLDDLLKGFFFQTGKQPDDAPAVGSTANPTGYDPVAHIDSRIAAGAALHAVIVDASITGGINFNIDGYLDVGGGDRIRLADLEGCFIDPLSGKATADVLVKIEIGFDPFSFTKKIPLVKTTLANFDLIDCPPPNANTSPVGHGLATLGVQDHGADELVLNVGLRADERIFNDDKNAQGDISHDADAPEYYEIRLAQDRTGGPLPGDVTLGPVIAGALDVTGFGITQRYGAGDAPIHLITGDFGLLADSLVISDQVFVNASIKGGAGDDFLSGGSGNDYFEGNADDDYLIGNAGNDTLLGGAGDDDLEGGAGADSMDGGTGRDKVSYESSATGVTILRNGDQLVVTGAHGSDADGDTLHSIEYIVGSDQADTISSSSAVDDVMDSNLEGRDGNDILYGADNKRDFLMGGAGADMLIGGGLEDGTSYLTSFQGVHIDMDRRIFEQGDAQGDQLQSIEDVQGSGFNDVIFGDGGSNKIDGYIGSDRLSGGAGRDTVTGGEGNDTIFGWGDGDKLDGGGYLQNPGRDLLTYEVASAGVTVNLVNGTASGGDTIAGAWVITGQDPFTTGPASGYSSFEDLTGSLYADTLTGDFAGNLISGLAGDDSINGQAGDDTLIGGAGKDTLIGGSGFDWADYSTSSDYVVVDMMGASHHADAEGDVFTTDFANRVENLTGSGFADTLFGDNNNNIIDPGLSERSGGNLTDFVDGRGGTDMLYVDYSRALTTGHGVVGGFTSATGGLLHHDVRGLSGLIEDGVSFQNIERLYVIGTGYADSVQGGGGADVLLSGAGNDTLDGGSGGDVIDAGSGNDVVRFGFVGTPSGLFAIAGGSGIDSLSLNFAGATSGLTILGPANGAEGRFTNFAVGATGAAIYDFEILQNIVTGKGNDYLRQDGVADNNFSTGDGADVIYSGLGHDTVDAGNELAGIRLNTNGDLDHPTYSEIIDPETYFSTGGDVLILDYSSITDGSRVDSQASNYLVTTLGYVVRDGENSSHISTEGLYTSLVHYNTYFSLSEASHANDVVARNIERVNVTGSMNNDVLMGTYSAFNSLLAQNAFGISPGRDQRGNDYIDGGAGNDLIYGFTGSDTLKGGDGDDTLYGNTPQGSGMAPDTSQVDELWGGKGEDTFVVGGVFGGTYFDATARSDSHFAHIMDFKASDGDVVELAGSASDYYLTTSGTTVTIHAASNGDVIAKLEGITGGNSFDLHGSQVQYDGGSVSSQGFAAIQSLVLDDDTTSVQSLSEPDTESTPEAGEAFTTFDVPPPPFIITATNNPDDLAAALGGTFTGIHDVHVTIDGDADAVGTFTGDPFGLGSGIILSTGRVEDLAGANTVDGHANSDATTPLDFTKLGTVDDSDVYVAKLSGLGDLNSLTLRDSNSHIGGGPGDVSGFDIDAVILSTKLLTKQEVATATEATLNGLPQISGVLDFTAAGLVFHPGTQRPSSNSTFPNTDYMLGANSSGIVDNGFSRLQLVDPNDLVNYTGSLSLGDGGQLGLNFDRTLSTDTPVYLYVVEDGSSTGETLSGIVTASQAFVAPDGDLSTDLGDTGAVGDTTTMTFAFTPDEGTNEVQFQFVLYSEELPEFAGTDPADTFRITLNGVEYGKLHDGSAATLDNLMMSTYAPVNPDLILNPATTGPLAGVIRADAYTTILTFKAPTIADAENILKVQVADGRDAFLDSGILIQGGSSFHAVAAASLTVTGSGTLIEDGPDGSITVIRPANADPDATVTVHLTPSGNLDIGAGLGNPVDVVFGPGETGTKRIDVAAADVDGPTQPGIVNVEVHSTDPDYEGLPIAPVAFTVINAIEVPENTTDVTTLSTATANPQTVVTWQIVGGADQALFEVNAATGELAFKNPPDFEAPADQGHDNYYDIVVQATADFQAIDEQHLAVEVTDVAETSVLDVKYLYKQAGYNNTLGWYDTRTGIGGIVFPHVDNHDPQKGQSAIVEVPTADVPYIGYFIIPNGGAIKANSAAELSGGVKVIQLANGSWGVATLDANGNLQTDGHGNPNLLVGIGVNAMFTETAKNPGDLDYASSNPGRIQTSQDLAGDTADGPGGIIGWEDTAAKLLGNGSYGVQGDADFDDGVFSVTVVDGKTLIGTDAANLQNGDIADDNLYGKGGDDTLNGLAGDDRLDGGKGADKMSGGAGNDIYIVDNAGDVIIEALNAGQDWVQSSVSYTLSPNVEYLTLKGNAALTGTGNVLDNILVGNNGANTLDGAAGRDQMVGGAGNDTYIVDNVSDVVVETANAGDDTVRSSVTYALADNVENLTLLGTSSLNGTGNGLANLLTGNDAANTLDGGAGIDTMIGLGGNDTYVVNDTADVVTEAVGGGNADLVLSSASYTLSANVENLTLTGGASITATGNELNNVLAGNGGANTLDGGLGADKMSGGGGSDTYIVDDIGDQVSENSNAGTDLVRSSFSYTLGNNVENLTLTGTAITGKGNSLGNVITGTDAGNTLDGAGGSDQLIGLGGDDTYIVDKSSDTVVEAALGGTDIVLAAASFVLSEEIENLTLTGTASINGTGNSLDNILIGTKGNNVLDGAGGADTMTGGNGDDTYVVDDAGDQVVEAFKGGNDLVKSAISYMLGSDVENLTLTGALMLTGTGNGLANTITGNAADNTIDGGAGADHLAGQGGNDTYIVDNSGDVVIEGSAGGTDLVLSSVSFTLGSNVENLTLTGLAAAGTGNAMANVLTGTDAANTLDGGANADQLIGRDGSDTYIVDNASDHVVEQLNQGTDLVLASVSFTLEANVENLTLTGTGSINGTGNDLDNSLIGNKGNNVLDGGIGADAMTGGSGNDTYVVDNAGDTVIESGNGGTDLVKAAIDYVLGANVENLILTGSAVVGTGNSLNNALTGSDDANTLNGGDGKDTLQGGLGADHLFGGPDAVRDVFVYTSMNDSGTVGDDTTWDRIEDFNHASGSGASTSDIIDLHFIDAGSQAGDQAFRFVSTFTAPTSGQAAGQVHVTDTVAGSNVEIDINGDNIADMILQVVNVHGLTGSDFFL